MMLMDFRNKLQRLNRRLRITNTGTSFMAGIQVKGREEEEGVLVGVSKLGLTRDRSRVDKEGHLKIRSVRDVLFVLSNSGHIDKRKAERVFGMRLDKKHPAVRE